MQHHELPNRSASELTNLHASRGYLCALVCYLDQVENEDKDKQEEFLFVFMCKSADSIFERPTLIIGSHGWHPGNLNARPLETSDIPLLT